MAAVLKKHQFSYTSSIHSESSQIESAMLYANVFLTPLLIFMTSSQSGVQNQNFFLIIKVFRVTVRSSLLKILLVRKCRSGWIENSAM